MLDIDLSKYNMLLNQSFERRLGKVTKVVGLTIESIGPTAKLKDLCRIITKDTNQVIHAEVVGFRDDRVILMPYDQTEGVGLGSRVENTNAPLTVMVDDSVLGKTLDGLGRPIDGSTAECRYGYSSNDNHFYTMPVLRSIWPTRHSRPRRPTRRPWGCWASA